MERNFVFYFADDVVLMAEKEEDMDTMLEVAYRYSGGSNSMLRNAR